MSVLGVRLTMLIGSTVPVPVPLLLTESLESIEVKHSDKGRSGFEMTFLAGRAGVMDLVDYPLLRTRLLEPYNRVILIVTFNVTPRVLMDGIITNRELTPGEQPGTTKVTVIGEDIGVMMDLVERSVEHPAQPDWLIVSKLILRYARYGLIPEVLPTKVIDMPLPPERTPVQQCTDLGHIEKLGRRHGHVFSLTPGPVPGTTRAYWGPPRLLGIPQRALSVDFGSSTNVDSISFNLNALEPENVEGDVQDHQINRKLPVLTFGSLRPPLSAMPHWLVNRTKMRTSRFREVTPGVVVALGRAQAQADRSTEDTLTATGKLDAGRYGDLLQARGLVGLRGVGWLYDGLYYVKEVTHSIRHHEYSQSFTLTREGLGSLTPVVRP